MFNAFTNKLINSFDYGNWFADNTENPNTSSVSLNTTGNNIPPSEILQVPKSPKYSLDSQQYLNSENFYRLKITPQQAPKRISVDSDLSQNTKNIQPTTPQQDFQISKDFYSQNMYSGNSKNCNLNFSWKSSKSRSKSIHEKISSIVFDNNLVLDQTEVSSIRELSKTKSYSFNEVPSERIKRNRLTKNSPTMFTGQIGTREQAGYNTIKNSCTSMSNGFSYIKKISGNFSKNLRKKSAEIQSKEEFCAIDGLTVKSFNDIQNSQDNTDKRLFLDDFNSPVKGSFKFDSKESPGFFQEQPQQKSEWSLEDACCEGLEKYTGLIDQLKNKYKWIMHEIDQDKNSNWVLDDIADKRLYIHVIPLKKGNQENCIFRSEIITEFPVDILIDYINNQKQRLKNRGRIKSVEVLQQLNDNVCIEGCHIKGIWPMKDRTTCNYISEFFNENDEYINLGFDCIEDMYPKKGALRIDTIGTLWVLTKLSDNKTKMVHYSNGDAKLSGIPQWVIKKGIKDSMHLPLKIVNILEQGIPLEKDQK